MKEKEEVKSAMNQETGKHQTEKEADAKETPAEKTASSGKEEPEKVQEPSPQERIKELENENTALKDQYLRKVADFENFRKRMMREKQEAFDYANTALLTDLIAILDDFDRAIAAAADSKDRESVVDGIKMINKQMRGLLEAKYNLSCYGAAGDVFDHNIHEAIGSADAPVKEPVCAEVYLKGYKLKDRVIRPAKVLVHMPEKKEVGETVSAETSGTDTE